VDEAIAYCSKTESRIGDTTVFGEPCPERQGRRSDLDSAVQIIKDGGGIKRVAEECPRTFVKYSKGFVALENLLQPPKNGFIARTILVHCGKEGTGKTRWCYETYPELWRAPPATGTPWFDGYTGQEVILLDDYANDSQSRYPYSFFLQLLDGYEMQVPVKGGFVRWNPKIILITSNTHPSQWYVPKMDVNAMLRRINEIKEYD